MKKYALSFFALLLIAVQYNVAQQSNAIQEELIEVNQEWEQQQDATYPEEINLTTSDDYDLIKLHLQLVEQTLRKRDVSHLSSSQRYNREQLLDALHSYWESEAFPINTQLTYRNPVFIDEQNNYCAVGHLIKASGNDVIAREIAATENFAFVKAIEHPQLLAWANNAGFTVDELAWIQPSYPPQTQLEVMGEGTNGVVYDVVETEQGDIIAAGKFSKSGTMAVQNLAMWTSGFGGFDWTDFHGGVNGNAKSLLIHNGEVFVGGQFTKAGNTLVTNVAKWDGSSWKAVGALNGTINDLVVFNNEVYAAGNFTAVHGSGFQNIAKWDGSKWTAVASNGKGIVNGTVETLEVIDNMLYVGGSFTMIGGTPMNNIAKFDGTAFSALGNGVPAKVRAIAAYNDEVYAGGDFIQGSDTFGIARFSGSTWENLTPYFGYIDELSGQSITSLVADKEFLVIGGKFRLDPFIGNYGRNLAAYNGTNFMGKADLDSTVEVLSVIGQSIYMGGAFKTSTTGWGGATTDLNSIAHFEAAPATGIDEKNQFNDGISLYPNPTGRQGTVTVNSETGEGLSEIRLYDTSGKLVMHKQGKLGTKVELPAGTLESGTYFINAIGTSGNNSTKPLLVH
jgi:hypothetical protein